MAQRSVAIGSFQQECSNQAVQQGTVSSLPPSILSQEGNQGLPALYFNMLGKCIPQQTPLLYFFN